MVAPLIAAAGRAIAARGGAAIAAQGARAGAAEYASTRGAQLAAQEIAGKSVLSGSKIPGAKLSGKMLQNPTIQRAVVRNINNNTAQGRQYQPGTQGVVQAPTHNGAAYGVGKIGSTQFSGFGQMNLDMGLRGVSSPGRWVDGEKPDEVAPDRANLSYRRPSKPGIGPGTGMPPAPKGLGSGPKGLPPGGSGPAALPAGSVNNLPVIPGGGQARFPDDIEVGAKTSPLYSQKQPKFKQQPLF
jgi:hypothetical protein